VDERERRKKFHAIAAHEVDETDMEPDKESEWYLWQDFRLVDQK
jgi:hypothetical protein